MTDEPRLVAIAGDWHKNERHALKVIPQMAAQLAAEDRKIILQAGDFGIWRERAEYTWMGKTYYRQTYLEALTEKLEEVNAEIWFVDGNHEDHPYLTELAERYYAQFGCPGKPFGWITARIRWLPRGTRWTWHDQTWIAAGGAVSVDKFQRTEGKSWFPEEEITPDQEEMIITKGPADVILSHDAPSSEPLNLLPPPEEWLPMIPAAEAHRERLERICAAAKPSHVFHGHYHRMKQGVAHAPWGSYEYLGLDMDGTAYNWGVLDTRTMDFFFPQQERA